MRDAEAIPLAESYKKLIREGALYSEIITDKTLKKNVDQYKELYEKAIAAKDAIEDLRSSLADLAKTRFDNAKNQIQSSISEFEHFNNMIDKQISSVETLNKIAGKSFYNAKIDYDNSRLDDLRKQREAMYNALKQAEQEGLVEVGSEAWANMRDEIYSVDEAVAECSNEILDLKQKLKEVAKLNFDNLKQQFENAIGILTSQMDVTNSAISLVETSGHVVSQRYYSALMEGAKTQVTANRKELEKLSQTLADAMSAGDVELYDDNWYQMTNDINEVKKATLEAAKATIEYANALRQVDWDLFDRMQDGLKSLIGEAEFFIDIMSHEDLLKDGEWTDAGLATIGMHVQNYETYMADVLVFPRSEVYLILPCAQRPDH